MATEITENDRIVQRVQDVLDTLHEVKKRITLAGGAGDNLDVSKVPSFELQNYEDIYHILFTGPTGTSHALGKIMRANMHSLVTGLDEAWLFYRNLQYARTMPAGELFELKDLHCLNCHCTSRTRNFFAARVAWVEKRKAEGKTCYPNDDTRYAYMTTHPPSLHGSLSAQTKWLVDKGVATPVELHALMTSFMQIRSDIRTMDPMIETLSKGNQEKAVAVEDISIPWTAEAMASEDKTCAICTFNIGPEFDDDVFTEPAVKARACGHVLGRVCLQQWIAEHNTCPVCRRALYGIELSLPQEARGLYADLKEVERALFDLDEEVDSYLLDAPRDCYGRKLETLLAKLQGLCEKSTSTIDELALLVSALPEQPVLHPDDYWTDDEE